jgi:hypothetical protein
MVSQERPLRPIPSDHFPWRWIMRLILCSIMAVKVMKVPTRVKITSVRFLFLEEI